jgi:hypothetical protein
MYGNIVMWQDKVHCQNHKFDHGRPSHPIVIMQSHQIILTQQWHWLTCQKGGASQREEGYAHRQDKGAQQEEGQTQK